MSGSPIETTATIQDLLTQLQEATTNTGGSYEFFKMPLPDGESLLARIQQYITDWYVDQKVPRRLRKSPKFKPDPPPDVSKIDLKIVANPQAALAAKLTYWKDHRTSLDRRENDEAAYSEIEPQFTSRLWDFLDKEGMIACFEAHGLDDFGPTKLDMAHDDLLFETRNGVYLLHFGWSS